MKSVQILWVGCFYKEANDGIRAHSHPFYHMIYVSKGKLQLTAGDGQYELSAGGCVLIPKEMRHAYINPGSQVAEYLEYKFTIPKESLDSKFSQSRPLISNSSLVGMLCKQILQEYTELGGLADEAAEAYLQAILQAMTEDRRRKKKPMFRFVDAGEYSELAQQVIRYLERNYDHSLSLDELARKLGNNKSYLCTAFKKNTQITINDCLNMIRIRRAAELVAYSDNDLAQIAAMCGFSSVSHFNRVFLKYVGTTPGQCRRAYPVGVLFDPDRQFQDMEQQPDRFMYSVLAQKQITPEMILSSEKDDYDEE